MRYKNLYGVIIVTISAIALSWILSSIVKLGSSSSPSYPFVYYSSILQDFVGRQSTKDGSIFYDRTGSRYTLDQYDSLTPLLNYRQLSLDGRMPDTILGHYIEPRMLRVKTIAWRYAPRDIATPVLDVYIMYETMSGRANLASPDDVFTLDNKIEFIDKFTRKVDHKKSALFQERMEREDFRFPAISAWGDPSIRKPYDEGFFVLDSDSKLYHIKMVNGRPYVKNTGVNQTVNIAFYSPMTVADRSIYGFLVSTEGDVYTLNTEGYEVTKFDIPRVDIKQHTVALIGNMFYWIVNVTTSTNCTSYALDATTLLAHDTPYVIEGRPNKWLKVAPWLAPIHLEVENKESNYVCPQFVFTSGYAFILSALLALLFTFTIGRSRSYIRRVADVVIIVIFGIPGLLAAILIR